MTTFQKLSNLADDRGFRLVMGPLRAGLDPRAIPMINGRPNNVVSVTFSSAPSVARGVLEARLVFRCYSQTLDAAQALMELVAGIEDELRATEVSRNPTGVPGAWPNAELTMDVLWQTTPV